MRDERPKYEYRTATLISSGLIVRATKVYRRESNETKLKDTGNYHACVSSCLGEHVLTSVSGSGGTQPTEATIAHDTLAAYLRDHPEWEVDQ